MATSRLKLGTAVTNMVYQDPTVLAGSAATLSDISDGRAVLGLGTGDGPVYAMGRRATRLREFEEGVRTIRNVLQGGELVTPNNRVSVNYRMLPTPVYLSMEGPKGLRLAGRVADGVFLGSGVEPRAVSWALTRIAEGAAEAGRSPDEIATLACGMVCIKDDGDEARQIVRRRLANRAHHNFQSTLETVPEEEMESIRKFMASLRPVEAHGGPLRSRADHRLSRAPLRHRRHPQGVHRASGGAGGRRRRGVMLTPARRVYEETVEALAEKVMPAFGA